MGYERFLAALHVSSKAKFHRGKDGDDAQAPVVTARQLHRMGEETSEQLGDDVTDLLPFNFNKSWAAIQPPR